MAAIRYGDSTRDGAAHVLVIVDDSFPMFFRMKNMLDAIGPNLQPHPEIENCKEYKAVRREALSRYK